jgi:hypothetical protein
MPLEQLSSVIVNVTRQAAGRKSSSASKQQAFALHEAPPEAVLPLTRTRCRENHILRSGARKIKTPTTSLSR